MSTRMRKVSQVALLLAAGAAIGIAAVAACGGPMNRADAGNGTDAGGGGGVCCTGPVEIQQPISVTVDDTTPIDVNITNTIPVDVTLPSPLMVAIAVPTFKGVTTAVFDGAGGWDTMNASCSLSFPGSRVCTDRDLMNTYPAPVPGTDAWMVTLPYAMSAGNPAPSWGGWADTGLSTANCATSFEPRIFSTAAGGGNTYVITASGDFDSRSCMDLHPAACCGY
jgi:hypothetical protein